MVIANRFDDQKMEVAMGHLLRFGVLLAAAVVIVGGALQLWQARGISPNYRTFHGAPQSLESPVKIWRGVLGADGASVIQFGLLLLIATPVARVALGLGSFLLERDWLYSVVSFLVLGILLYSLVKGVQ